MTAKLTGSRDLTAIEALLRDGMAVRIAVIAGELARELGMAEPTTPQIAELQSLIRNTLTTFVVLLRERMQGGAPDPTREEIEASLQTIALSALEHVMGPPPARDVVH